MFKKLKKNEKGFTLVELIVVIAILGVLAALIVPRIVGNVGEATLEREVANARTLASEITVYNAQHNTDITNDSGGYVTKTKYDAVLDLPEGIEWPDSTKVQIKVDVNGNAAIKKLATTPIPTAGP